MLTMVEVISCRDKLRDADELVSQVRGTFIIAQYSSGARIAADILKLIVDLVRALDAIEQTLIAGGRP